MDLMIAYLGSVIVFFFSSRRRHTRCGRDWSSDVCSSDLRRARRVGGRGPGRARGSARPVVRLTGRFRKRAEYGRGMTSTLTDPELVALLERAIDLAVENAEGGHEPFGALVWLDGRVLAEGVNAVHGGDPTAHAETAAVRAATLVLGSPHLTGAVVVASGEPCAMCVASSAVADVAEIVFAAPKELVPALPGPHRP